MRSPRPLALAVALAAVWAVATALSAADDSASSTDWPSFGNDPGNTRYSPLSQIDASNFARLEIAWRWTSSSQKVTGENPRIKPGQFKAVPIVIDGLLYVATELSQVVALDAGTGELVWELDPRSWEAGRPANVGFQHRGVAYWQDGETRRIFVTTHDRRLISLDARTGATDPEFGKDGFVDLLPGDGEERWGRRVNRRLVTHSSPPAIVGSTVVVGSIIHDGATRQEAAPGHVQAFDARTGALRWIFHTIPQQGEPGVETWENDSWRKAGNTNVWTTMAVDEELGAVYLPVSTPTDDFYGGHRLGDNLYAESIVCLDAQTGERRWHFQAVHHGLWDYDFPTAPNLVDITVDGKRIPALAQVSKQAFTYVLDRRTGKPVWPVEERPVPPSDVPGERASPTQPFPTRPPPFDRQGTSDDVLIDLTPELKEEALEIAHGYRLGPLFTPPSLGAGTLILPSAGGGANWPGAAVDPETGILYVPSMTSPGVNPLAAPDPARSDLRYVGGYGGARSKGGLPLVKPPWGRVTAIDLNQGTQLWMTPNGYGPRHHPALAHLDLGLLGGGSGAPLLTKTLLFVTQQRGPGAENTPRINVFDKRNGELLGHVPLPADPHGNPVTYRAGGKQIVVVAVGGGPFYGGFSEDAAAVDPDLAEFLKRMPSGSETPELVALALP